MYTRSEYIYHNEKSKLFYGRYNASENDIVFLLTPDNEAQIPYDRIFFPSGTNKVAVNRSIPKTPDSKDQDISLAVVTAEENKNKNGDADSKLLSNPTNSRIKYEIIL